MKKKKSFRVKNVLQLLAVVLLLGVLGKLLWLNQEKSIQNKQEMQALLEEEKRNRDAAEERYKISVYENEVREDNSVFVSVSDVLAGRAEGTILLTPSEFARNITSESGYMTDRKVCVSRTGIHASVKKTDLIILQFCAYTSESMIELTVDCGSVSNHVYVSSTPSVYYIPVCGVDTINTIRFTINSDFRETIIDSVYLINYKNDYNISQLKTGSYSEAEFETVTIEADSHITNAARQCLVDEEYLYSLEENGLICRKKGEGGTYEQISEVEYLGDVRDMVFAKEKKAIVVTARQNGMYIIDCSDPFNLSVASHYDTIELASGLAVSGDYAFLCDRLSGIHIVDISDISHPVHVNQVGDGTEYFDCCVDGAYLYVGVYIGSKVDVYDIEDLSNPKLVTEINLDGYGQGVCVKEGLLYVATGLQSSNDISNLWSYGKGTGNGMEIYDVSEIADPRRLSVVKTDGRYSLNTMDVWDVAVSGNYAYLSSMYNGMYMYDISDPTSPVCIRVYNIVADIDACLDETAEVYPFDVNSEGRGCVNHTIVEDGMVYLVSWNEGIYSLEVPEARKEEPEVSDIKFAKADSVKKSEEIILEQYEIEKYDTEYSVWAAAVWNDKIYVACGEGGIHQLDQNLELEKIYECEYSVRDVKVSGNYLYTAENEGGLGVYLLGEQIVWVASLQLEGHEAISTLEVSGDGKYIIAQALKESYVFIDIEDPRDPRIIEMETADIGMMYYRNICTGLVDGKYMGIYGKNNIAWYYSENGKLEYLSDMDNIFHREWNGMTAAGDMCLVIYQQGYYYFSPEDSVISDRVKIRGVSFEGKCISDGEILVISSLISGEIMLVDITKIDKPVVLESFTVEGNPDIACFAENSILIPCRYGGLIQLKRK
ncbi:MAG: hypothetical protein MR543_03780 [Robinsoniella sp.]|nr:hypothetical protein [Robinsoniella sp.]